MSASPALVPDRDVSPSRSADTSQPHSTLPERVSDRLRDSTLSETPSASLANEAAIEVPASASLTPNIAHPLPSPLPMASPAFVWGLHDAESFIQAINVTYSEVVHWKKNSFFVPYGNVGKQFVSELSKLYRAYAEGSAIECIALKAATVMSLLLLQKPSPNSKPRDHRACLERRLKTWSEGDLNDLVMEGRTLQNRLGKGGFFKKDEDNIARSFSNLMFKGNTSAALQLLSQSGKGGVMHANERWCHA